PGAEEPTSLALDNFNNFYVGGWTSSTDFPVTNAMQSTYGGGADDGFLLHLQPDGNLYSSTYYGGSGSDRVLGLFCPSSNDMTVLLAGQTTSVDLPLKDPVRAALAGISDGFLARVSSTAFVVSRVVGAKNFRAYGSIYLGFLD